MGHGTCEWDLRLRCELDMGLANGTYDYGANGTWDLRMGPTTAMRMEHGTYEWDLGLRCEWDMGLRCEWDCDATRAFLGHEIGIVISVCREHGQSTPIVQQRKKRERRMRNEQRKEPGQEKGVCVVEVLASSDAIGCKTCCWSRNIFC